MRGLNEDSLILDKAAFDRTNVDMRMDEGGFNSIAKFELFSGILRCFCNFKRNWAIR